jgi:hypothetical protein
VGSFSGAMYRWSLGPAISRPALVEGAPFVFFFFEKNLEVKKNGPGYYPYLWGPLVKAQR